jgi:hypothetical protein
VRGRGEEGQAATELALVLPFVVLLLLAAVQVTLVARDQILVVHAAREAARAASVEPGRAEAAARAAALRASGLAADRVAVETSVGSGGEDVVVVLRYRAPTDVVLVGRWVPALELRAKAAMRMETEAVSHGPPQQGQKSAGTAS